MRAATPSKTATLLRLATYASTATAVVLIAVVAFVLWPLASSRRSPFRPLLGPEKVDERRE